MRLILSYFPRAGGSQRRDLKDASAAVYVISRISGEGKDRAARGWGLLPEQKRAGGSPYLDAQQIPVILILNSGGPIELTDILEETDNIQAILNISQPGQESGYAVADILFGKRTPEGKLTATWAKRYEDLSLFGYIQLS